MQKMRTNDSSTSEYNLYFIISRSIIDRDDIYSKFGTCRAINNKNMFITYDTNNPLITRTHMSKHI